MPCAFGTSDAKLKSFMLFLAANNYLKAITTHAQTQFLFFQYVGAAHCAVEVSGVDSDAASRGIQMRPMLVK